MEFHNEELGVKFAVPDRPTVFQQMAYQAAYFTLRLDNMYWRSWVSALGLISDWKCEAIPDPALVFESKVAPDESVDGVYLDEVTDPTITGILIYVGNSVMIHITNLEDIPKN